MPPPHAASSASPPTSATVPTMRRVRREASARKIPTPKINIRPNRSIDELGLRHRVFGTSDGTRISDDDRAVVVTTSSVPEMAQLPWGIEHVALSVGCTLKPLVLIWNVKELPAVPDCDGWDGVTAGEAANVAVAVVFAVIVNMQTGFVLLAHTPDQLENVAFAFGTAVSVMGVAELKLVPGGVC